MTALYADTVMFNGRVHTLDDGRPRATAVAMRGGKIALVGSDPEVLETADPDTGTIDLAGRVVVPGFIDTHIHPSMAGQLMMGKLDLKALQPPSMSSLIDSVRKKASETPEGEWILGWGYDEERLLEGRHPDRWELDEAAPRTPVFLAHACGHVAVCNTLALTLGGVGKGTPDPKQGMIDRDAEGAPTGVLRNRAQEMVRRRIPPWGYERLKEGLRRACERLASWGVTSIHDAWSGPALIRAYQELLAEGRLPIRVGLMPPVANPFEGDHLEHLTSLGIRTGFGGPMLRIVGVKVAVDGMIRSRTAALHDGYEGEPDNRGLITIDVDDLDRRVSACNAAGLRVCIHAEGDRGIDVALDAVEKALDENPVADHRHRIEHFGLSNPEQMRRMRRLGVIPSVSINFVHDIGEGYGRRIGSDRSEWLYPLRSLAENGVKASGNSD